jgi:hypothetical protein
MSSDVESIGRGDHVAKIRVWLKSPSDTLPGTVCLENTVVNVGKSFIQNISDTTIANAGMLSAHTVPNSYLRLE